MCGIAGFLNYGEVDEAKKTLIAEIAESLFVQTKARGTDAAGFSYINKFGELITVKGPVISDVMVADKKFTKLKTELPKLLIMHCRAATTGSPVDNFNNHPLVADKRLSVIHNGVISNHQMLKTKYSLPAKGEVDSEVIPMMIIKNLDDLSKKKAVSPEMIAKAINMSAQEISGGYACAALSTDTPEVLYLFRNGNPIVFGYAPTLKTLFFASVDSYISNAFNIHDNIEIMSESFPMRKNPVTIVSIVDDTLGFLSAKDGELKLNFFNLETMKYGTTTRVTSRDCHYDTSTLEDLYGDTTEETTEKITKTLKKKNGLDFDATAYQKSKDKKEDWEIASSCGSGC